MASLASGYASIAICDRCNFKFSYQELRADGNSPGLRVCKSCRDPKNPWRLPPLTPDAIALKYPRPDTPLVITPLPMHYWNEAGLFWDGNTTIDWE